MFKFKLARDTVETNEEDGEKKEELQWISASKLQIIPDNIKSVEQKADYYTEKEVFPGYNLRLIRFDKVVEDLTKQKYQNIIEAESRHSDLIPAKYEGGLKIWECTYDLGQYILREKIELKDKLVLDLGCGTGLIGLMALLNDSAVHFQDYNAEVLRSVTIPNILLNFDDHSNILTKSEFYAGDWESFATLFDDNSRKYDYIFTSETIYNPDNYRKLCNIFRRRLNINGTILVAGKAYYFGVGGGTRQFENLVLKDRCFNVETVWRNQDGNKQVINYVPLHVSYQLYDDCTHSRSEQRNSKTYKNNALSILHFHILHYCLYRNIRLLAWNVEINNIDLSAKKVYDLLNHFICYSMLFHFLTINAFNIFYGASLS